MVMTRTAYSRTGSPLKRRAYFEGPLADLLPELLEIILNELMNGDVDHKRAFVSLSCTSAAWNSRLKRRVVNATPGRIRASYEETDDLEQKRVAKFMVALALWARCALESDPVAPHPRTECQMHIGCAPPTAGVPMRTGCASPPTDAPMHTAMHTGAARPPPLRPSFAARRASSLACNPR